MKKKREDVLVPFFLAVTALVIFAYRVVSADMANLEIYGFLFGLLAGHIGTLTYALGSRNPKLRKRSRYYYALTFFGIVIVAVYFSKYFGFGYFIGYGISICFGHTLLALVKQKEETNLGA